MKEKKIIAERNYKWRQTKNSKNIMDDVGGGGVDDAAILPSPHKLQTPVVAFLREAEQDKVA